MRYVELVTSVTVRDRTPSEAGLIVQSRDLPDFHALLNRCGNLALVERARPGPDLPFMYYVRCGSPFEAGRLERAWKDCCLSKLMGRELRLEERHWPLGDEDEE